MKQYGLLLLIAWIICACSAGPDPVESVDQVTEPLALTGHMWVASPSSCPPTAGCRLYGGNSGTFPYGSPDVDVVSIVSGQVTNSGTISPTTRTAVFRMTTARYNDLLAALEYQAAGSPNFLEFQFLYDSSVAGGSKPLLGTGSPSFVCQNRLTLQSEVCP